MLHIEKTRTTPYHPQSDGQIERFNRTLLNMLFTCSAEQPKEWDQHLVNYAWHTTPVSIALQDTLPCF